MRFYYDCEFLEDGKTIELISIGMVAEDGRELYLVNRDAPWKRIKKDDWLMANVVPSLLPVSWPINFHDPAVKGKAEIADAVRRFLTGGDMPGLARPEVELWAWYGAYDHVALAQLFGRMIDLPAGVPMWTNDLRQEVQRLGDPQLPEQPSGLHNALEDARYLKVRAQWLAAKFGQNSIA